jgi:hypothetical protein
VPRGTTTGIKSGSFCLNATRVNDYATITPHHLAALSLSRAADALPSTETDPATWFFIILDLHRALYCALIAALSGPAEIGAYPEWLRTEWIKYFEESRTNPDAKPPEKEYVEHFTKLLSWAEDGSAPLLQLTAERRADILKLNEFRGDLDHVKPRDWRLRIGGLPRMSMVAAEAFEILLQSFRHRLEEEEIEQVETTISKIKDFGLNRPSSTPQSWL